MRKVAVTQVPAEPSSNLPAGSRAGLVRRAGTEPLTWENEEDNTEFQEILELHRVLQLTYP